MVASTTAASNSVASATRNNIKYLTVRSASARWRRSARLAAGSSVESGVAAAPPSPPVGSNRASSVTGLGRLHVARHLEDRQIHGDNHTADHGAQKHHHDGLDEAGHGGDGDVDLLLVEVSDLRQ